MELSDIKGIVQKYTKSKKNLLVVFVFLIGFIFLMLPSLTPKEEETKVNADNVDLRAKEEKRLEEILSSVDGINKVKAMICFSDGGIKEYYKDESEDRDEENIKTNKKMVIARINGSEAPVLKRELRPDIKGVSIVVDCKRRGLEETIYSLTSKALGVDIHKIEVVINDRSR